MGDRGFDGASIPHPPEVLSLARYSEEALSWQSFFSCYVVGTLLPFSYVVARLLVVILSSTFFFFIFAVGAQYQNAIKMILWCW